MLNDERECKGIGLRSGKGVRNVNCDRQTLLLNMCILYKSEPYSLGNIFMTICELFALFTLCY